MRRDARAANMSLDGHGAVQPESRRSRNTFPMRPIPLAGAGDSLMCTLRDVRFVVMRFLPWRFVTTRTIRVSWQTQFPDA
jgi:hypothetical protein